MIFSLRENQILKNTDPMIFLNGLLQTIEYDYTLSGDTILFKSEIIITDNVVIRNGGPIARYCNEKEKMKIKINNFKDYYENAK